MFSFYVSYVVVVAKGKPRGQGNAPENPSVSKEILHQMNCTSNTSSARVQIPQA
jgi:hypothetical protein